MPITRTQTALLASGGTVLALMVLVLSQRPTMDRHVLAFEQAPGPEGWTTSVRLDVRPPHLEWWLGWRMHGCEPLESAGDAPRFRCLVDLPSKWGCAQLRGWTYAFQVIDPDDLDKGVRSMWSDEHSNIVIRGDCPDPMPERVPLATPEPGLGLSLAFGVLGIRYGFRRRSGAPHRWHGGRRHGGPGEQ